LILHPKSPPVKIGGLLFISLIGMHERVNTGGLAQNLRQTATQFKRVFLRHRFK